MPVFDHVLPVAFFATLLTLFSEVVGCIDGRDLRVPHQIAGIPERVDIVAPS